MKTADFGYVIRVCVLFACFGQINITCSVISVGCGVVGCGVLWWDVVWWGVVGWGGLHRTASWDRPGFESTGCHFETWAVLFTTHYLCLS